MLSLFESKAQDFDADFPLRLHLIRDLSA